MQCDAGASTSEDAATTIDSKAAVMPSAAGMLPRQDGLTGDSSRRSRAARQRPSACTTCSHRAATHSGDRLAHQQGRRPSALAPSTISESSAGNEEDAEIDEETGCCRQRETCICLQRERERERESERELER